VRPARMCTIAAAYSQSTNAGRSEVEGAGIPCPERILLGWGV